VFRVYGVGLNPVRLGISVDSEECLGVRVWA